VVIALFVCAAPARAQIAIGPGVGYSFGVPLTVERRPEGVNQYGETLSGTSYDHALWFGMDVLAPGLLGDRWDCSAELALALSTGFFRSDPFSRPLYYDSVAGAFVSPLRQFDLSSDLSALQLDVQAARMLDDRWSYRLGIWLQYRLAATFVQQERLLDQDGITFSDGTRSHLVAAGETLGGGRLRYGPTVSGALRLPFADGLTLIPHLDLRLDLPALLNNMGARSLRIGGGAALLLEPRGLAPVAPVPVIDSPAIAIPVPARRHLSASIALHGNGDDTARASVAVIRSREILHRRMMPFLPRIFFDPDSAGIPDRYARLSSAGTDSFSDRSLARMEPVELYHQMLNLLGSRLRSEPSATITLIHPAGGMMEERADRVRGYLQDVWGIDRRRIRSEIARGEKPDPADAPELTVGLQGPVGGPVESVWIVRELQAPSLGITQRIDAEAGLRAWRLRLTQGSRELAAYAGRTQQELSAVDLSLRLDGGAVGAGPVVATLMVLDSAGDSVSAEARLDLLRDDGAITRREVFSFLLPDLAGAGLPGDGERMMIREIAASARDGARVTIMPAGDADDGALERIAGALLAELRGHGVHAGEIAITRTEQASGGGPSLPEEMLLNSGVVVTIEQEGEARDQ